MPALTHAQIDAIVADKNARIHFVGIGGTGMSAYADFRALSGGQTSGSDRGFDQGANLIARDGFLSRGIQIFPQDGRGINGAAAIVVSVAIEQTVPDYAAALSANIPIITRKEWLAAHYRVYKCIAITGTSGKSTVTAMVFEILRACGRDPGLITGADLMSLMADGGPGNAYAGTGPLVLEADESDKGIGDYTPDIGVILNLQRDHDEPENMLPAFAAFQHNCTRACIVSDDAALKSLRMGAIMYGETATPPYQFTDVVLSADTSSFMMAGQKFNLPVPGLHNVHNAAAAITVGLMCGLTPADMAAAFKNYRGVARRFETVGRGNDIEVIDDYAHNPAKIAAVIKTAAARGTRTILWYQPHGFGPTRFMRPDLVAMFAQTLRPQDILYVAPILYLGGTATKDISSDMLIDDIKKLGHDAISCPTKEFFLDEMKTIARAGDVIVIVGGRDPSLPGFARDVARAVTQ